ncbi:hypothetical protein M0802_000959 [Mischocyttarus mexicanus]|nr:hypothetical protein M0802_000959 [Mischocyttarus mexicanus]
MVSGCLRDIICRNKHMSINCKTCIYKTCVRSIMTYAIETRVETTAIKRLRTITGKTLFDHQCNDDIRRECNIQDIV